MGGNVTAPYPGSLLIANVIVRCMKLLTGRKTQETMHAPRREISCVCVTILGVAMLDYQNEFAMLAAHIAHTKSRLERLHPTQLEQASGLGRDDVAASLIASIAAGEAALSLLQDLAEDLDRAGCH